MTTWSAFYPSAIGPIAESGQHVSGARGVEAGEQPSSGGSEGVFRFQAGEKTSTR